MNGDGSSIPGMTQDAEMWSSKSLNLTWLSRRDNWHNPSLLSAASLEGVHADPQPNIDVRFRDWFWRVDITFGAWLCRAIRRADQAKADLPACERRAFSIVRNYLQELQPNCWDEVEAMSLKTVMLPGLEIVTRAAALASVGLGPPWKGYERYVPVESAEEPVLAPRGGSARPSPVPAKAAKPKRTDDDRPKLF